MDKGECLYLKGTVENKRSYLLLQGKIGLFKGFSDNHKKEAIFFGTEKTQEKKSTKLYEFEDVYGSIKKIMREGAFFGHRLIDGLEAKRMLSAVSIVPSLVLILEEDDHDHIFKKINETKDQTRFKILKEFFPYIDLGGKNSLVPLMDSMIKLKARRGQTIITEDRDANYMYLLLEGRVKLSKRLDSKKLFFLLEEQKKVMIRRQEVSEIEEQRMKMLRTCIENIGAKLKKMDIRRNLMIGSLKKLDVFGEEALFQDEKKFSIFTAVCETDCSFMMIKDRDLKSSLPFKLNRALKKIFDNKVRLRLKRYTQQCPPLLKNFEEKVKKMDFLNLANLFEFVNQGEKSLLINEMVKSRSIDLKKGKSYRAMKSKISGENIFNKIQGNFFFSRLKIF